MDRKMLERHLEQAEAHVKRGGEIVRRQRDLLAELERDGHDTAEARRLLADFEKLQAMHVADRDRILREIEVLG